MDFTPEQWQAITHAGNLVVTAGAGSGKTRVLVERYLRLLVDTDSDTDRDILAITFTEKAAREMRDRVRATVEQRARAAARTERAAWEERRAAIEAARIGTIHSFCATLLRAHPAETGLDPHFGVLDEVEALLLLTESVDAALGVAVAEDVGSGPGVTILFDEFGLGELRTILTEMVRAGAEVRMALADLPDNPAALRQEWRTRLAELQADLLNSLLSGARWREACATLQNLVAAARDDDRIGTQVRTIADWLAESGVGAWQPADAAQPATVDFHCIDQINLRGCSKKNWPTADDLAAAKEALRTLRDSYREHAGLLELVGDDALEERAAQVILALRALYRRVVAHYTRRKEQRDTLDYDDLEVRARDLLERHPAVRARWQAELRTVLVDEFQDTNEDQRAIIAALTGLTENVAASPGLFIVGDAKQSIYRFRGADVSVFQAVAQTLQDLGGQAVALNTSFRAHPPLLDWINATVAPIFAREEPLRGYEVPFEQLLAHRPPPAHAQCVELHIVPGEGNSATIHDCEAQALAARIQALVAGEAGAIIQEGSHGWRVPRYGDMALLFQASTAFEHYERAFRTAGIPYLTTAGRGYYGRKEVQDLIHLLRVLDDPADELALVGVLRSPLFALDDATILRLRFANPHSLWDALLASGGEALSTQHSALSTQHSAPGTENSTLNTQNSELFFARETLRELHALRGQVTVVELLRAALAATGYPATISGLHDGERRRANVEKLLEAARRAGSGGLSAFSAYLDALLRQEPREGEAPLEAAGSVQLMTVHRSKGLEFPIVVLPDLGRRSPPQTAKWLARRTYGAAVQLRGATGDWEKPIAYQLALAEERRMERAERERLLYVALTRVRDYLLLSGSAAKQSGDDWLSRLLVALGTPWEAGGPAAGTYAALQVFRP
ncbi:MAG: UvrD-helicase domain-containing protein [Chloroflexaceae bacterium]